MPFEPLSTYRQTKPLLLVLRKYPLKHTNLHCFPLFLHSLTHHYPLKHWYQRSYALSIVPLSLWLMSYHYILVVVCSANIMVICWELISRLTTSLRASWGLPFYNLLFTFPSKFLIYKHTNKGRTLCWNWYYIVYYCYEIFILNQLPLVSFKFCLPHFMQCWRFSSPTILTEDGQDPGSHISFERCDCGR